MSTPTNEKYEQFLEENNRGARISIILELTLNTRKREYDLTIYADEIVCLTNRINALQDEFEKLVRDIFSDTDKTQEFDLKLEELMRDIEHGKELLEDAVRSNLYDL